jgi:hypothetical protein
MDNQLDFFVAAQQQPLVDEIKRLSELNRLLITLAQELGAANDVAEWDDAWNRLAKVIIAEKNNGL